MKTKLTALAFLALPAFTTPTFAAFTLTADGFTNNGDGTVTDENTGLVWQACAVGQTFNNSTGSCDGTAKTYTYADALKLTSDFGGQTDWRVPTISELNSIVDLKKSSPAINKSLFPNPPASSFWSTSTYAGDKTSAWFVYFSDGYDGANYKYSSFAVRLVRGEQSFYSDSLKLADFVDNKDGTVTHKKTGLTWQRCAVGQTWNSGNCEGKAAIYKQEEAAKLTSDMAGQTDWHLPSLRELQTIVDYSTVNPSTNLIIFPDAPSSGFWTTTPSVLSTGYFWLVHFSSGNNYSLDPTTSLAARLVRGTLTYNGTNTSTTTPTAQTGSVDLTAKLSATPTPAKINQTLTYTATVTNKGKATATGTKVTFYLAPNFMSFKTASAGCETTPLSVICNVGDLAAGGNTTKTMTVNLKKAGGISSSVLVKSNEQDANPADNVGKVATGVKK